MKAVIVEINDKYAIALDKSGAFIKTRNSGKFNIGEEIELPAKPVMSISSMQRLTSIAATVVVFVCLSLAVYGYVTPYSYINIDINPSVEITSNIFDRIIKVEALNDDGNSIVSNTDCTNKSLEDGIELILGEARKEGYLADEEKSAVMFTVSARSEKKTEEIKKDIEEKAEAEVKTEKIKAEVLVQNTDIKQHDDAKKAGISPGKLLLIEKLKEVEPEAKVEELKKTPVKEIMKNLQSAKKQEKNKKKGNKENTKNKDDNKKVRQDDDEDEEKKETVKTDVHKKGEEVKKANQNNTKDRKVKNNSLRKKSEENDDDDEQQEKNENQKNKEQKNDKKNQNKNVRDKTPGKETNKEQDRDSDDEKEEESGDRKDNKDKKEKQRDNRRRQ